LNSLSTLLDGGDGEVLDLFEAQQDALRNTLEPEEFAALRKALVAFDFSAAGAVVKHTLTRRSTASRAGPR
jgi:hypothetical protein